MERRQALDDAVRLGHGENPLDPLLVLTKPGRALFQRRSFAEVGHTSIIPSRSRHATTAVTPPEPGFYVDLHKAPDGNLHILLNRNGRRHFAAIREERDAFGTNAALCALLEDHLSSGWEMVPPEDIGALTAAPILSDEITRDDHGRVTDAGRVFWFPDYQVRDEIEELRKHLVLVFQGVE